MTNQGNIIETIKTNLGITNLSLGYESALFALFQSAGITNTEFNGAYIEYLQLVLGSTKTNITDLLAEYSQTYFDGNVNSINDLSLPAYIFTVKTDNTGTSSNDQFTLPLISGGTYDSYIDWGDGSVIDHITAYNQAEVTHTFTGGAGTYIIKCWGTLSGWTFNNGGDKEKITIISQWGILDGIIIGGFYGCSNLTTINAPDYPRFLNTAVLAELNSLFTNCTSLTYINGLENWTALNTTNHSSMFFNASINQNVSKLITANVSSVNNFIRNTNIDQDLSSGDFSNITSATNFALGTSMSTANYDALLVSLGGQTLNSGVAIDFGNAKWKFGFGGQSRFDLLSVKSFTSVTDGGQEDSTMGCWLNAHNSLKAIANPSDGTSLVSWKDLSDNNLNAEDATGFAPLFKTNIANGEPMVYFNGSSSRLDIPADAALDSLFNGGGFFICAILPESDGQSSQGRVFSQGGGNCHLSVRDESAGTCRLRFVKSFGTTDGVWESTGLDINLNEINIVAMEYNSSDAANDPIIYINSLTSAVITEASTPVGTPSTPSGIQVGNAGFSNRTFDGYLGDLGFFKSIPSSTEKDRMIQYFATKYGKTLS